MNNFENFIDELKEENLLEETIAENVADETEAGNMSGKIDAAAAKSDGAENNAANLEMANEATEAVNSGEPKKDFADFQKHDDAEKAAAPENNKNQSTAKTIDEAEFFRKRAVEEVSGLQLVEHIFSGVERQQKKAIPKPYDDLNVKKALHAFLQVSGDAKSPEHAQAEFQLMQETESWYSALSHRDKLISVSNLRVFCETAKPALSAQALIALARFYRNSPYSEAVRSKFDLIVTRLFTKDLPDEKREITFERDELITHLAGLYAEWESVSLYGNEGEDESDTLLAAFKFEDLMSEARAAANFDELVRNDFYNRLRAFKESIGERFFAPLVTATAIECNTRVGNRFIELLEQEKASGDFDKMENKYGFLHDQVISDAASKTLQLVELLKHKTVAPPAPAEEIITPQPKAEAATTNKKNARVKTEQKTDTAKVSTAATTAAATNTSIKDNLFAVNKWLLRAAAIIVVASVSLYVWANYNDGGASEKINQNVKRVNLDNSSLSEYVRDARIGNDTFFAVVLPSWNAINREKKEEILKKIASFGADKNFKTVHLLTKDGKTAGAYVDGVADINN